MAKPAEIVSFDMRPPGGIRPEVVCCSLGRVDYDEAWELQKSLQGRLVQARRGETDYRLPHVLILLEHPPVYTLGKSGKAEHLLLSEDRLRQLGATFYRIGRGGDITFHGPGQLVGYPILDLHDFRTDLTRYVRTLEEVVIRTCSDFGVQTHRSEAGTGVWARDETNEAKICAFGIRCSRWVTMHGFAFNLNTDLAWFDHIVPCGITDRSVTTLARETGKDVDEQAVRRRLICHFADLFGAALTELGGDSAMQFLKSPPNQGT